MPSAAQLSTYLAAAAALSAISGAVELQAGDRNSTISVAKEVAAGLLSYYDADNSYGIGLFPAPYYWWEAGCVWDSMVNYWYLTGDEAYNDMVQSALLSQTGDNDDYLPVNQTKSLGNDDQAIWALAAMSAAERDFPAAADQPRWIDLAKAVFDSQAARWDASTCGGGLRWQLFSFNAGYDYKNTVSQAVFFQLAARLARFTGNQTYAIWASKTYDWTLAVGLIDAASFRAYDGTATSANCSQINHLQWSYVAASLLYGSAVMHNITANATWTARTDGHLAALADVFFPNGTDILVETACEPIGTCDTDQFAMKSMAARWMAGAALFAPWTAPAIDAKLAASAAAAAAHCSSNSSVSGTATGALSCTDRWDAPDGASAKTGLGQQVSVLDVIQANLMNGSAQLATAETKAAGAANGTATDGAGAAASGTAGAASPSSSVNAAVGTGVDMSMSWGTIVAVGLMGLYRL